MQLYNSIILENFMRRVIAPMIYLQCALLFLIIPNTMSYKVKWKYTAQWPLFCTGKHVAKTYEDQQLFCILLHKPRIKAWYTSSTIMLHLIMLLEFKAALRYLGILKQQLKQSVLKLSSVHFNYDLYIQNSNILEVLSKFFCPLEMQQLLL